MQTIRRSRYILQLAAVVILAAVAACTEEPLARFRDISSTSTSVQGHWHVATIPSEDIDELPFNGRTYETTTDGTPGHRHTVFLSAAQLAGLQRENGVEDAATTPDEELGEGVAPHGHVFVFQN